MIEAYDFGRMTVAGEQHRKDLKIVDGAVRGGWWRGAGHRVEVADVADVLAAAPEVLVVGTGAYGKMEVSDGLRRELEQRGIALAAAPSAEAAETFNRLYAEGRRVAGAFHLTC